MEIGRRFRNGLAVLHSTSVPSSRQTALTSGCPSLPQLARPLISRNHSGRLPRGNSTLLAHRPGHRLETALKVAIQLQTMSVDFLLTTRRSSNGGPPSKASSRMPARNIGRTDKQRFWVSSQSQRSSFASCSISCIILRKLLAL